MTVPLSELTAILRDVLCDKHLDVTISTRFEEITAWDSMDLVTVVVEVECRYELEFQLNEIERLITVGDLLHMVAAKQALTSA